MENYAIYNVIQKATKADGIIFLLEAICAYSDFRDKDLDKHLVRRINTSTNEISEWTEIIGANPFHSYTKKLKEQQ